MNVRLKYRHYNKRVIGIAIARNVRLTKTLIVIEPKMVEVLSGTAHVGSTALKFKRESHMPHPRARSFSNGGWRIDSVEE